MFLRTRILPLLLTALVFLTASQVSALQLQLASGEATANSSVSLDVSLDTPVAVAAALFSLSYDTEHLHLAGVESTFFDTFANQWDLLDPPADPAPPASVSVNGENYDRPLLFAANDNGAMVIGVRVRPGAGETTLLTLNFDIAPGTPDGVYPITITPLTAGQYALPVLVSMNDAEPDPALAYADLSPTLISGAIAVSVTVIDSDHDGIEDSWEMLWFGDLDTADSTSDFDGDGYTDLQEYLNQLAGAVDGNGKGFDPTVKNAPGGTGFSGQQSNSEFWMLFNTVIQNAIRSTKEQEQAQP